MANRTRIPAVIDALVTRMDARLADPIQVFDGRGLSNDSINQKLFVGVDDPDSEDAPTAATARHEFRGIGKLARQQFITVFCTAVAWNGDGDAKKARDDAYAVMDAAEAELQSDASIVGNVMFAGIGEETCRQNQDTTGAKAHVTFTIECEARLSA